MAWNIGDGIRLTVTCLNAAGVAADPSTVVVKVLTPDDATTTYTYPANIVKSATGIYYYDFTITLSGKHYYKWITTGDPTQAEEGSFIVMYPNVT